MPPRLLPPWSILYPRPAYVVSLSPLGQLLKQPAVGARPKNRSRHTSSKQGLHRPKPESFPSQRARPVRIVVEKQEGDHSKFLPCMRGRITARELQPPLLAIPSDGTGHARDQILFGCVAQFLLGSLPGVQPIFAKEGHSRPAQRGFPAAHPPQHLEPYRTQHGDPAGQTHPRWPHAKSGGNGFAQLPKGHRRAGRGRGRDSRGRGTCPKA